MRQLLLTFLSVGAILGVLPAIAQDINPNINIESGFAESDARNGVVTDSRGFRHSQVSVGRTVYHQPAYHGGFGYPVMGGATIVIGPGTVVRPQRPIVIRPRPVHQRGIVIAPTFNVGGGFNSGLCTRTNTVTSSDGMVFQSTTTEPCHW